MCNSPRAVYIHVPFCRHRCGYCNFTVVAGRDDLQSGYLEALETELQSLAEPREVDTIYVGGGTPTELTVPHLQQLCQLIKCWFIPTPGCEWSIEANPFALTRDKLELLATAGVNRISLGVQSFDSQKLTILERDHRATDIVESYRRCRDSVPAVSLDLIFAVPQETPVQWRDDLECAMQLRPEHLSVYGLTFEKGARFWSELARGRWSEVDEERQRAMYQLAIELLTRAGWEHYEISNFARTGHRCRHNEVYWTGREYYGFGPGAARYVGGRRETNHRSTFTYIRRAQTRQSLVAESEVLTAEDQARERLVFGLRMLEGIDRSQFSTATGFSVDQLVAEPLGRFVDWGLLDDDGQRIRLTGEGLLISDSLWPEFLS